MSTRLTDTARVSTSHIFLSITTFLLAWYNDYKTRYKVINNVEEKLARAVEMGIGKVPEKYFETTKDTLVR